MLNTVWQLTRPRQFEAAFQEIETGGALIVRPTHLSVCNADQRYYQGKRPAEVLAKKLPMALIHEGIGIVMQDPSGTYAPGSRVVMIPNVPREESPYAAENYLRSSLFRGSTMDGFMQEYIATRPDRVLPVPESLGDLTAAFTEMVSVCWHAISRFDAAAHGGRETIGVWGDGNMGYFTALLLRARMPKSRIIVFGVSESKMNDFSFVDDVCPVSAIPADLQIDHGFECVGGAASGAVISQIIDHIRPEGTIAILGVSEEPVPVWTRMVLEKGLRIIGTSRSGRADFEGLLGLYESRREVPEYLEKMGGAVIDVRGIPDMVRAFETDIYKERGKTVMVWNG